MPNHYTRIYNTLESRISSGEISDRLPSIAQLQDEFGVSSATVKKIIERLKLSGLVYGIQGKGVFVKKKPDERPRCSMGVYWPLVIFDIEFFSRLLDDFYRLAADMHCEVRIYPNTDDLLESNSDWAILLGLVKNPMEIAAILRRFGNRVISCNMPSDNFFSISNDNCRTGYAAIKTLYEKHHRRIGIISRDLFGKGNMFDQRMQGALDFAAEHPDCMLFNQSIEYDTINYFPDKCAEEATVKLIGKAADITAIFAFTDIMALGVLSTLQKMNISVPEDISLISVDNAKFAPFCYTPLTTFEENTMEFAQTLITLIFENFQTGLPADGARLIAANLKERSSVIAVNTD